MWLVVLVRMMLTTILLDALKSRSIIALADLACQSLTIV